MKMKREMKTKTNPADARFERSRDSVLAWRGNSTKPWGSSSHLLEAKFIWST